MSFLETERLVLRRWTAADWKPFAAMNVDPLVMEFFDRPLSAEESKAAAERIQAHFERHGFGLWAVELRESKRFIGFMGLSVPGFRAHFTPCVEIGWRLSPACWGRGLATEAARKVLQHGFEQIGLEEIVSFTSPANLRSRRVMEKLGMTHDSRDDFEHPGLPQGHGLRPHVLYRLTKEQWRTKTQP